MAFSRNEIIESMLETVAEIGRCVDAQPHNRYRLAFGQYEDEQSDESILPYMDRWGDRRTKTWTKAA